jgi:hypothetical protein
LLICQHLIGVLHPVFAQIAHLFGDQAVDDASAPLAISRPAFRKAIVDYIVAFDPERVLNDPGSTVGVIVS